MKLKDSVIRDKIMDRLDLPSNMSIHRFDINIKRHIREQLKTPVNDQLGNKIWSYTRCIRARHQERLDVQLTDQLGDELDERITNRLYNEVGFKIRVLVYEQLSERIPNEN
jgi:ribosomal protein L31E